MDVGASPISQSRTEGESAAVKIGDYHLT